MRREGNFVEEDGGSERGNFWKSGGVLYVRECDKRDRRNFDWINRLRDDLEYDGRLGDGGAVQESRDA
jgi:hypothetical protein